MTRKQNGRKRIEFDRRTVLKTIGASSAVGIVGVPALSGQVAADHNDITSGLVAHYPLENTSGDVEDVSGNNNDGTNHGATRGVVGPDLNAFEFDGTDDWVEVPDDSTLDGMSDLTFSGWFNFPSMTDSDMAVVGMRNGYEFIVDGKNRVTSDAWWAIDNGDNWSVNDANMTLSTDTWHHFAVVSDSTANEVRIYHDGSKVLTDSGTGTVNNPTNQSLGIGNRGDEPGWFFEGKIDDIRIYNRVLSDSEIKQLATRLIIVDDDIAEGDENAFRKNTIQEGVDTAESGDTVRVKPGTYDEDVTVDVGDLTLEGPNAGICGDDDDRGSEATIEGQVVLSADGTTLDGFDVSPPPAEMNAEGEAVRISNTPDDVTVKNNVVRDFEEDGVPEWEGIEGIVAFGGDATDSITNATICCNKVENIEGRNEKGGAAGIMVQGNVASATIKDNVVSDIGLKETMFAQGVVVTDTDNHNVVPAVVDVVDNELSSIRAVLSSDFHGVGVGIETDGTAYLISENEIKGNNIGVEVKVAADDTEISGNEIKDTSADGSYNNGGVGIFIGDDNTTIKENEVKNTDFDGIRGDGDSSEIKENEVKDSGEDGIHLLEDASDNTVKENEMKDSDDFDAHDDSNGSRTAGTANTWEDNECETDSPDGLCGEE